MHECLNGAYSFIVFFMVWFNCMWFYCYLDCCRIKFPFVCLLNYFIKYGRDEPSGFLAISLVKFESL